jgi:hypothetical protein
MVIELPRGVARAYRAVLRKSVLAWGKAAGGDALLAFCRSGPQGLELLCENGGVLLRHAEPGKMPAACVAFPASLLAQFEGRDGGRVRLEVPSPGRGRASWGEGAAGRALEFPSPEQKPPEVPSCRMAPPGDGFRAALEEAARTAGGDSSRQALRCVLLRGNEVVATDGRQLLVQKGFKFPWDGDALIPALPAFACKEVAGHGMTLGRAGSQVLMSCGPWLLALECQEARHYPDVGKVMAGEWPSTLTLDEADAAVMLKALPGLPGRDEQHAPVTLEIGTRPRVRAGGEEVAVGRSKASGPALAVPMARSYLLRALSLGFREVVSGKGRPLMCRDASRSYLWMPLDDAPPSAAPPEASPRRKEADVPGGTNGQSPGGHRPAGALEEAEAIKAQLQEALARTARLLAALKKQKREDRVVKDAAASLRRLGGLGG